MHRKTHISIPHPRTRRALLIVDVEPKFLMPVTRKAVPGIISVITSENYALYVVAEYHRNSTGKSGIRTLWQKTRGRFSQENKTLPEIMNLVDEDKLCQVPKSTRSLFGNTDELADLLKARDIREVHIVGLETHDCVLATALDAFDHDFVTCVIEEACSSKNIKHHDCAIEILRKLELTNHSIKI